MTKFYAYIKRKLLSNFALSGVVQLTICFFFLLSICGIARAVSGASEPGSLSVESGFNSLKNQCNDIFDSDRVVYDSVSSRYDTAAKKTLGQAVEVGGSGIIEFIMPAAGRVIEPQLPSKENEDLALTIACSGDKVQASANGFVSDIARKNGEYEIRITHSGGFVSVYSNLKRVSVSAGDYITACETIGYLDESDCVLRFAMTLNGKEVNPLEYIDE